MTFTIVVPFIFRSSRPETDADLALLDVWQVKTILDLESGIYETLTDDEYEKRSLTWAKRIDLHWSPVFWPSIHDLYLVAGLMNKAAMDKSAILVHCKAGKDRTGMAVAAYRIVYDAWPAKRAIEEMKQNGFHTWIYWYWIKQLYKLEAECWA